MADDTVQEVLPLEGLTHRIGIRHEPEDEGPDYCGLGVCSALAGHEGTCDEASGWDEPVGEAVMASVWPTETQWVRMPAHLDQAWTSWTVTYDTATTHTINTENWFRTTGTWTTSANITIQPSQHDEVWGRWGVRDNMISGMRQALAPEVTRRERERQELRDQLQRQREEASRRRLAAQPLLEHAKDRAEELLDMVLTAAEKVYRDQNDGKIMVTGGDTGDLYIVDTRYGGVHGNIRRVDEHGCVLATLCVAPRMEHTDEHGDRYGMPLADGYVGQILTLKHNERELLAKANFSGRRQCSQPNVPILGQRAA